ncbi:LuxR C-terminal-related transcriptional regulator [Pseudomonas sp. PSE14]|uniref:LuxR C-terminal-related transcriptional regulator n=1 Tax=Pseudomonas sp. PSE14 TaxID=3016341 RepID=UPI0023D7BE57|nr:LuxR C-terminal-related transcriptional regulator [Pseudomonas sp. PSE14]WEJ69864.1 LuxR C-terminal-related transcriptional regulator [Pseudomonas sp. PSE14]
MARVVVVEALPAIRQCLESLLERMGHSVVGSVADGREGLDLIRRCQPDLSILALSTPGRSGLDLVHRAASRHPDGRILVYTALNAEQFAPLCFKEGVSGFVSKQEDLDVLEAAIESVLKGRSHYPAVALEMPDGGELAALSPRELSVLQLLAEGKSNQAIADTLSISFKTVSTHKTHLQEKLHVRSRLELVELARRHGLGEPGQANGYVTEDLPAQWHEQVVRLRAMLDAAGHPMFLRDRDGRLLLCNQSFLDFYQVGAEEVAGQDFLAAQWFDEPERQRIGMGYERLLSEEQPFNLERTLTVRGVLRLLHIWGMPFRDASGQVIGIVGGIRDMTEQAQLMAELRHGRRQAEIASEARFELFESIMTELGDALAIARDQAGATRSLEALERLMQRLAHLAHLARAHNPPEEACDVLGISVPLLKRYQARLRTQGPAAAHAWIAVDRYRELLETLCQMTGMAPAAELTLRRSSHGVIEIRLTLAGRLPDPEPSAILLRIAELLAKGLGGQLERRAGPQVQRFILTLELEEATQSSIASCDSA